MKTVPFFSPALFLNTHTLTHAHTQTHMHTHRHTRAHTLSPASFTTRCGIVSLQFEKKSLSLFSLRPAPAAAQPPNLPQASRVYSASHTDTHTRTGKAAEREREKGEGERERDNCGATTVSPELRVHLPFLSRNSQRIVQPSPGRRERRGCTRKRRRPRPLRGKV